MLFRSDEAGLQLATLAREVAHRTSIELEAKPNQFTHVSSEALDEPWLWVRNLAEITTKDGGLKAELAQWLKRGGFLIIEPGAAAGAPAAAAVNGTPNPALTKLTDALGDGKSAEGWMPLPPDHELMRSFYLLDALPSCNNEIWRGYHYDGRLAILALPYGFLSTLKDKGGPPPCANPPDQERSVRVFVNLIMVALATDYKKDQIHLPEILKRLR